MLTAEGCGSHSRTIHLHLFSTTTITAVGAKAMLRRTFRACCAGRSATQVQPIREPVTIDRGKGSKVRPPRASPCCRRSSRGRSMHPPRVTELLSISTPTMNSTSVPSRAFNRDRIKPEYEKANDTFNGMDQVTLDTCSNLAIPLWYMLIPSRDAIPIWPGRAG